MKDGMDQGVFKECFIYASDGARIPGRRAPRPPPAKTLSSTHQNTPAPQLANALSSKQARTTVPAPRLKKP